MLPQRNRLTSEQIQKVFQSQFVVSQYAILYTTQTHTLNPPRGTVVVGKKVSKQAVKRNYLKRVARAVVIQNLSQLQKGLLFIIVLKPTSKNGSFLDIKNDIEHLFRTSKSIQH